MAMGIDGAIIGRETLECLRCALEAADDLCRTALPQFNYGASALNADAIRLLNEAPGKIKAALTSLNNSLYPSATKGQ